MFWYKWNSLRLKKNSELDLAVSRTCGWCELIFKFSSAIDCLRLWDEIRSIHHHLLLLDFSRIIFFVYSMLLTVIIWTIENWWDNFDIFMNFIWRIYLKSDLKNQAVTNSMILNDYNWFSVYKVLVIFTRWIYSL